jgi:antitoxin CptB
MKNDIDNLKKRLIYRSQYRGTKEMDKLVGKFVQLHIDKFDFAQLKKLEKFLDIDDDTLYKFYTNQINNLDGEMLEISKIFKKFNYQI